MKATEEHGNVNYHQLQEEDENICWKKFDEKVVSSSTLEDKDTVDLLCQSFNLASAKCVALDKIKYLYEL